MMISSRIYHDLAVLPAALRALLDQTPYFDLTLPWLETYTAQVMHPEQRLCVAAWEAGDARALLPLCQDREGRRPWRYPVLHALTNYYTANYAPVLSPAADADAMAQACARLVLDELAGWRWFDLQPMDPDSAFFRALADTLAAAGCYVRRYFRFGNWYLDVAGRRHADYYAGLSSQLRNTLRRREKKLRTLGEIRFRLVQDLETVEAALADYSAIYYSSWKPNEPYMGFIHQVARRFAALGWLRFGLLDVNGQPVAAQLWFVYQGTASIFKLAYDPRYAEYSAGSMLTNQLMRHVIDEDRVHTVDYLCGDDAYKKDWMSHRRERWGLRAYAPKSLAGMLARAGQRYAPLLRSLLSRDRPIPVQVNQNGR